MESQGIKESALVKIPEKIPPAVINSETVLPYLVYPDFPLATMSNFAPQLDLTMMKPYMEYLYHHKKDVYIVPAEMREQLKKSKQAIDESDLSSDMRDMAEKMYQRSYEFLHQKAAGERAYTVYYDSQDNTIKVNQPSFGSYTSTSLDTRSVIQKGGLPLLDIHTHPKTGLFSSADYKLLLYDSGYERYKVLKGILVLCPDMQVLALATKQTPQLPLPEVDNVISKAKREFEESTQHAKRALEKLSAVQKALEHFHSKSLVDGVKGIDQLAERGATRDEINAFISERHQAQRDYFAKGEKTVEKVNKKITSGVAKDQQFANSYLIQFARDMNVKLYYSTDMSQFKELSA